MTKSLRCRNTKQALLQMSCTIYLGHCKHPLNPYSWIPSTTSFYFLPRYGLSATILSTPALTIATVLFVDGIALTQ